MKGAEVKKRVLEELQKTPIVEVACSKAGVGRTAFYEWKKKDPKFANAVEKAMSTGKEFISDVAESQLLNAIKSGDYKSVALWLRTHRAEYRNRLVLENVIAPEMTPEQKALAAEGLRRMAELRAQRPGPDDPKIDEQQ